MYNNRPTFALYGIQDRHNADYSLYVHDHNLTIMQNGKVINFLQQERISRRKRDNTLYLPLKDILKEHKRLSHDYDLVFVDSVVGRTFISADGEARFEAPLSNRLATNLEKGKCWWFGKEVNGYSLNHELAHIFSCMPFFGKFEENSLLVHFDGGASLSNFSAFTFKDNTINLVEYHWDLKPFSSIFNANALVFSIMGAKIFDQNAVPGKFMGFAGLGSYDANIEKWLIANNYFEDIWSNKSIFFQKAKEQFGIKLQSFNQKNEFIQDVAATLQAIFTRKLLKKLEQLACQTKTDYLYYTGGSALNIVTNTKIIESNLFKDVFIPPCTEDSGLSMGAAAFMEWKKGNVVERVSPYINNWQIENYTVSYNQQDIAAVVQLLVDGKIVGICNGYGEAGPRALGNRSLLCLANSKPLAQKLSMQVKKREWYRPLAPIALEENVQYFAGQKTIHHLSKYMLLDFSILPDKQKEIAGAVHANGTTRFQTIFKKDDNQFMYDLLCYLQDKYQFKALLNTSFNGKNEPIVHTREDALASYHRLDIDALVVNGKIVEIR